MKKRIMAVLLMVFLAGSGSSCQGEKKGVCAAHLPDAQEKEIMIIYDKTEKRLEEIVSYLQKRMNGRVYAVSFEEEQTEVPDFNQIDLVLIGGIKEQEGLTFRLRSFLSQTDFKGKKVSPFWLTQEWEEDSSYEKQFKKAIDNGIVTPGIGLTWKEENREEELGRIDGWLTTACTFRQ